MSTTTVTAEQIADEVRSARAAGPLAGALALAGHYAEQIEFAHVPPGPGDGTLDRDVIRAGRQAELEALAAAMPDFHEDAEITLSGDEITVHLTISGTLDGEAIRVSIPTVFTVESGLITRACVVVDPADAAPLIRALMAGGFQPPKLEH